jgi:mannose-6-phosphate isomerase-like protein (cupin superfamily)
MNPITFHGGTMQKVNLAEKFARFSDHWSPKIAGELNGQYVKLVKLKGTFVWHKHEEEDELFLVIHGTLRMQFRDREVVVQPGEFLIVSRGVEHCPQADDEVQVLLFEPKAVLNTGNVVSSHTVEELEWV